MTDSQHAPALNAAPDANAIADLREKAEDRGESVEVTFPAANGETKRFVVSPRGTCVVLDEMREDSFNHSVSAENIATALRE